MTMADLREQLRRVEAAEPPDLWAGIESRATEERPQMDAYMGSVVAFRKLGSDRRRRVAAGLVAAAVVALTVVVAWEAFRVPTTVITPPAGLPAGWERCANDALGYSIGYPGDWDTTDILNGTPKPSYACRWFSPTPFDPSQGNVVTEGWGYPLEVGIGGGFDQELRNVLDPEVARVLTQEELLVDGHRAVRLEYETLIDLVGEPGLHYEYVIELDRNTTLIVHTTATRGVEGVYEENKAVVDGAVDSLVWLPARV
jgi:hypothetical protein